jgi:hypothetical protein
LYEGCFSLACKLPFEIKSPLFVKFFPHEFLLTVFFKLFFMLNQ